MSLTRGLAWAVLGLGAGAAQAHAFGRVLTLPVPVWLYMGAMALVLGLSVLLAVWWFPRGHFAETAHSPRPAADGGWNGPRVLSTWRFSVGVLAFTVAMAFVGHPNAFVNPSMTLFWIVWLLGVFYLSALVGGLHAALNPWHGLLQLVQHRWPQALAGRAPWPPRLGVWPAVVLALLWVWVELFAHWGPRGLGGLLLAYTLLNLLAAWRWGAAAWLAHGEVFGLWFGLVSRLAPWQWTVQGQGGQARWVGRREPGWQALTQGGPVAAGGLALLLFMLSSTVFDGLQATQVWKGLYWGEVYPLLTPWVTDNAAAAYSLFKRWAVVFDSAALVLALGVYAGAYALTVRAMSRLTGGAHSGPALGSAFALTLVPIAFVYHLAHYWTLLLSQGVLVFRLLLDPWGRGWGGALKDWLPSAIQPTPMVVWNVQMVLVVAGHLLSVYLAHGVALRLFPHRRQVLLSQWPMWVFMVLLTSAGLWVMAQPVVPSGR